MDMEQFTYAIPTDEYVKARTAITEEEEWPQTIEG